MKLLSPIFLFVFANVINAQVSDIFHFSQHTMIKRIQYFGWIDSKGFHLSKSNSKTTLNVKGTFLKFEFKDINKDGYKDILLYKQDNIVYKKIFFVPEFNRYQ
jgi:hypothetical protein